MPPKKARKKGKRTLTGCDDDENGKCNEDIYVAGCRLDYKIMNLPALKIEEILERGSTLTMSNLCETFSSVSDWLHEQKAMMKDLIRETRGNKAVPKTPRRGKTFAHIREMALMYRRSAYALEIQDAPRDSVKDDVEDTSDLHNNNEYMEAGNSIRPQENTVSQDAKTEQESVQLLEQQPEASRDISDEYVSAVENCEQRFHICVKVECGSPVTVDNSTSLFSMPNHSEAHIKKAEIKEEEPSSNKSTDVNDSYRVDKADNHMATRSVTREKAAEVEELALKLNNVGGSEWVHRPMPSTATAIIEDSVSRAAAGASRTRLQRAVHQHIVTTPCKREYKSAVQRVMNEQIIARNLSPKREPAPAQIRLNNIPNIAAMALVNSKMQLSKKNLEAMRREKEDLAAQLREEQCKERAERVRKEREEKAMKAQRRREEKEIEERLKAEARKQKEERDERRREVLRLQKSPGRTKTTSRVVSPARVLKVSAATDARVGTKLLFPCTPGRAASKLAKVLGSGEETSREPTMNTPSREIRRKVCVGKKTCTNSEDSMEDGSLSPRHHAVNQLEFTREERKRIMKQEHERQKRLREEETRRMNALNGQDVSRTQLRAVDNAVNHMHDVLVRKEERRLICEEEKKQWLKKEDSGRLDMDVLQKNQEEKIFSSKENEIDMIILDGDSSCQQKSNKQLRISEKKDIFVADKKEGEERRGEEEQAKTLDCMNIGSSTEQSNRVLQNISVNAANSTHKLPSVHSSYELTPDKILKPSSENNYNIEDLSSGDETDQEDAPRKKVPTWAEGNEFRRALENQSAIIRLGEFDFNEYFGEIAAPDLPLIFGTTKRYPRRGSSGVWESPIGKPRQGIGAFQNKITRK